MLSEQQSLLQLYTVIHRHTYGTREVAGRLPAAVELSASPDGSSGRRCLACGEVARLGVEGRLGEDGRLDGVDLAPFSFGAER